MRYRLWILLLLTPFTAQGAWRNLGLVSAEPFQLVSGEKDIFTLEGNRILRFDGEKWRQIGIASAKPASIVAIPGGERLYSREGNDINYYDGTLWKKIGEVSTGNVKMLPVPLTNELYVLDVKTVRYYNGSEWKSVGAAAFEPADLYLENGHLFLRDGKSLLQLE